MTGPGFPPPDPNGYQVWADHVWQNGQPIETRWIFRAIIGDLYFEIPAETEDAALAAWYEWSVRP